MKKVKIIIIWYDLALVFTNFIILETVTFLANHEICKNFSYFTTYPGISPHLFWSCQNY